MGNMGFRMATNLNKAGFDISVWSRYKGSSWSNVEKLIKEGLKGCQEIEEAVKEAKIVGMCVSDDEAVTDVIGKVLPYLENGTILLDHSTISPKTAIILANRLKEIGCYYIDAPISGGEIGAEQASLTIMVGGEKHAFEECKAYLDAISMHAVYMGGSGRGSITKLLNQHLSGINHAVVCEAVSLAKSANIDLEPFYNVINNSWGKSFAFERIIHERLMNYIFYPSYSPSEIINKDMHQLLELAEDLNYDPKFAKIASDYYQRNVDEGRGKWDQASVILCMEEDKK